MPHLLAILQLLLVVFSWIKPNKHMILAGSLVVGVSCLTLTGFMVQTPWVMSAKTLLYFIVGTVQVFYVVFALSSRDDLWRISVLAQPLMLPFLLLATYLPVLSGGPSFIVTPVSLQWHVISATLAYAILSLAAFFAFAIIMRQVYLKAHAHSSFVTGLPSLEVLEKAQSAALKVSVLALLASSVAGALYTQQTAGVLFLLESKSLLTLVTLVLLVSLLVGRHVCGVRGRQGARLVLLAYFLVIVLFSLSLSL